VKAYIAATSPFGKVIHGYSVAFGSAPGTAGGFLSLSETRITRGCYVLFGRFGPIERDDSPSDVEAELGRLDTGDGAPLAGPGFGFMARLGIAAHAGVSSTFFDKGVVPERPQT
jgi:hypothetical protein